MGELVVGSIIALVAAFGGAAYGAWLAARLTAKLEEQREQQEQRRRAREVKAAACLVWFDLGMTHSKRTPPSPPAVCSRFGRRLGARGRRMVHYWPPSFRSRYSSSGRYATTSARRHWAPAWRDVIDANPGRPLSAREVLAALADRGLPIAGHGHGHSDLRLDQLEATLAGLRARVEKLAGRRDQLDVLAAERLAAQADELARILHELAAPAVEPVQLCVGHGLDRDAAGLCRRCRRPDLDAHARALPAAA